MIQRLKLLLIERKYSIKYFSIFSSSIFSYRLNFEYIQNDVEMFRFEQTKEATYEVTGWNVEARVRYR